MMEEELSRDFNHTSMTSRDVTRNDPSLIIPTIDKNYIYKNNCYMNNGRYVSRAGR